MTTLLVFAQTTLLFKVTSFDNWFPSSNLAESQNDAAFPGRKKEARIRKSNNKKTKQNKNQNSGRIAKNLRCAKPTASCPVG